MTDLSDPMINIFGLTVKYLPLPHPRSNPIEPIGSSPRKRSTIGHGCKFTSVSKVCPYLAIRIGLKYGIERKDCRVP